MEILEEIEILSDYCFYLEELYGTADVNIAKNILAVIKRCQSRAEFIHKFQTIMKIEEPNKLGRFYEIYDQRKLYQELNGKEIGKARSKRFNEEYKRRKINDEDINTIGKKDRGRVNEKSCDRKRISSEERNEIEKLIAAGIMKQSDLPIEELSTDEITIKDVKLNEEEPRFLKGKIKEIINSKVNEVEKQPEGHLQRSAIMATQIAKKRKDKKEKKQEKIEDKKIEGIEIKDKKRKKENELEADIKEIKSIEEVIEEIGVIAPKDKERKEWEQREEKATKEYKKRCGKTTQLTQYLDEDGYSKNGRIGCTQPRRVAAISVSQRVAEEMKVKLGEEVGYSIRFEDKTTEKTRIKYMTNGMLLREYLVDRDLPQYKVLILDEAHERTVGIDILFGLLKETIKRRPEFKLIITSATLDADKFSIYFNKAPIIHIPGRTFPVEKLYLEEPEMDYIQSGIETIMKIHLTQPPGDILFFLTGQEEIDSTCSIINEKVQKLDKRYPKLIALPIYASLSTEQQKRIFEPAPPFTRKCIVATNIAETSITIDGIYFVVDSGFVKQKVHNPRLGMDQLLITPISQACADQRAGRAGRTGPGKCYRLYTEKAYLNEMPIVSIPEIQRANLADTVLILKAIGINNVIDFDYMDPPMHNTLISALHHLYAISALDDDGKLTQLGRKMAEFPLEPPLAKMLIVSEQFGCSEEVVTIVAALSVGNLFIRPKEKEEEADRRKRQLSSSAGDHLTMLQVYNNWIKNGKSPSWCKENYINFRSLYKCEDIRKQLIKIMKKYHIQLISSHNNPIPIIKSIVSGFFVHAAKRDPQEGYRTLVDGQQVFIHPTSSLFGRNPEWVVYHELVLTTKEYMREIIAIDPQWLIELAPAFYQKSDGTQLNERMRKEKLKPLFNGVKKDQKPWKVSHRTTIGPSYH
ncbi:ATP-dependent RNA helicase [Entamoeba histolytica HM-3:IMSS]|uniref:RNA helicase n=1 Tax=Entamoeba histolytica HM-3:IMSS TaxID=885315 RepID=M7W5G6_ENTHI|nr:ATP-dependent RNA helicase [Entamoeba histolytica HM-3:IMSS]